MNSERVGFFHEKEELRKAFQVIKIGTKQNKGVLWKTAKQNWTSTKDIFLYPWLDTKLWITVTNKTFKLCVWNQGLLIIEFIIQGDSQNLESHIGNWKQYKIEDTKGINLYILMV